MAGLTMRPSDPASYLTHANPNTVYVRRSFVVFRRSSIRSTRLSLRENVG